MSLALARRRMRHRCTIQRNASRGTSTNPWGADDTADWQSHLTNLPCWFWQEGRGSRTVMDSDKVVEISVKRVMVPLDADVTEDDRVLSVTDRLGATVATGPMRIDVVRVTKDHKILEVEEDR